MIEDVEIHDLRAITQIVKEEHGYDFSNYALSSLKRRILRVMEMMRIADVPTLLLKLKDKAFFKDFLAEITVNVTEMFRDPSLWRDLRDKVLPHHFSTHDSIKIWHAGCSSGEEVYSMCIVLKELGYLDRAKIFATDIDHVILQKAQQGRYSMKNMAELNEKNYIRYEGRYTLKDYYKEENGMAVMDKSLIANVMFKEHNLVSSGVFSKFDMILCRNVLIYFNQQLQNEVFKLFHESLFNYSYLIIGSKETLVWCDIANKFITVNHDERIFKKVKE